MHQKKARDLKKLLEQYRFKIDYRKPDCSPEEKERCAEALMDRVLGPEWRGEMQAAGLYEGEGTHKPSKDPDSLYDHVHKLLDAEGMYSEKLAQDPLPKPKKPKKKEDQIIQLLIKLES